jgi:hypothetical protein
MNREQASCSAIAITWLENSMLQTSRVFWDNGADHKASRVCNAFEVKGKSNPMLAATTLKAGSVPDTQPQCSRYI